jgi:hypothetical protein
MLAPANSLSCDQALLLPSLEAYAIQDLKVKFNVGQKSLDCWQKRAFLAEGSSIL